MNVAFDRGDNPVVLDFGSHKRFGEQLLSAGTIGWIDEEYDTSRQRHNKAAIPKLESWLISKRSEKTIGRAKNASRHSEGEISST